MKLRLSHLLIGFLLTAAGCQQSADELPEPEVNPPGTPTASLRLVYPDSILYIRPGTDNSISPAAMNKPGKFYGFPEGISIDELTGKIDIAGSEAGLRYKIMFVPDGTTDTITTKLVVSGITFLDKIYHLNSGDSIAPAVYNAKGIAYVPGTLGTGLNNSFDDDRGCNNRGCAVNLTDGSINLKETLRRGGLLAVNDDVKEFDYFFRMDDPSQKSLNKLKVKLYYYDSMADIPEYLWEILNDRSSQGVFLRTGEQQRIAKPRPPCIIVMP